MIRSAAMSDGDLGTALVLDARSLTKVVGKRTIVDDVTIAVREGEILGFLGPNGAGKTTTIRMLVGLIRPTSGDVRIGGVDLRADFERALSRVGCIVEQPDLYRFLTGRANLEHFARMLRVPLSQVEDVARIVGLDHRLDDRVRTYSLGMRQRLGIAQALLGDPALLILDEPANGLDPAGIREMRDLLRSLARSRRLGILISSHLLAEVEQVCDRVTIIHRGRVLDSGPVGELIDNESGYLFDCQPLETARVVLESEGIPIVEAANALEVRAQRSSIPALVERLVAEGVEIHEVTRRRTTLEEIFIDATHGESV